MAIDGVHMVHVLNKYVWARIQGEGILKPIRYQNIDVIPLVPVEETPELITIIESQQGVGSVPFLVYNWTKINTGQLWMLQNHEVAYSIRSADDAKMRQLINLFDRDFRDYDDAAKRVNDYISVNGTPRQRDFQFKTINVSTLGGQMPVTTENGVNEAIVTLRVTFTGP